MIRRAGSGDREPILALVNAAAEAYRGTIPADRWREPYMDAEELEVELADGVEFWVAEDRDELLGVMGIQPLAEVALIRHAYVRPEAQGRGIGRSLLEHLRASADRPLLVGTWAAAEWAIRFYERSGFERVPDARARELLERHWRIPERQIETSVVLAERVPDGLGRSQALRASSSS